MNTMRRIFSTTGTRGRVHGAAAIAALLLFSPLTAPSSLAQDDDGGARGFMASKGRTTYRLYCASCHGPDGAGDGPVAKHLKVAPTDLKTITERHGGTFPRDWIEQVIDGRQGIGAHGTRDMPVWGDVFQAPSLAEDDNSADADATRAERKIAELVVFLESIQTVVPRAKPAGP